jgi:hypothetical protein
VAWVDVGEAWLFGEDIYVRHQDWREGAPLVRRAGSQRHVAASEGFVGWIEDAAVCVESLATGERRCVPARPGPSRRLSLWGAVACWEDYGGDDIDVVCSDGLALRRPGHQRNPSRVGPWLLFQEGNQTLLATAEWIVLDDDDLRAAPLGVTLADPLALRGARAEGGVRYTLSLPPGRFAVERRVGEAWVPEETIEGGGAAQIEAPHGDAIRLRSAP